MRFKLKQLVVFVFVVFGLNCSRKEPDMIQWEVGSGGDYETWAQMCLGLAAASPLGDSYDIVQISDTTEPYGYDSVGVDMNGHDVTIRNASPHYGDPTKGYKSTATGSFVIGINFTNSGAQATLEIKELHLRRTTSGFWNAVSGGAGAGIDVYCHDMIFTHVENTGNGFSLAPSGDQLSDKHYVWNIATSGFQRGFSFEVGFDKDIKIENCTVLDATDGFYLSRGQSGTNGALIHNVIASTFTEFNNAIQYCTANEIAAEDTTSDSSSWKVGSAGGPQNVVLTNEFVSTTVGNPDFAKVKQGGELWDGGTSPEIPENTAGIRGDLRNSSIGADEFPSGSSSSSSSSEVCVDPEPPEPAELNAPVRVPLPNGRFTGGIKLKAGYNCVIDVNAVQNIVTIQTGLGSGEGMQCEDLRTDENGLPVHETCRDCSGMVYAVESHGFGVEELQLVGGPGVLILPDADNHRIVIRLEEEGICSVEV